MNKPMTLEQARRVIMEIREEDARIREDEKEDEEEATEYLPLDFDDV